MHPQLQEIVDELHSASEWVSRLASGWSEEEWGRRPAEGSWSAAECVAHLNLTSKAYQPILVEGIARARAIGGGAPRRFRKGLVGWMVWKAAGPTGRSRFKTAPSFVPTSQLPRTELLREFEAHQAEQVARVEEADGLPIHAVRVTSPFDPRAKYSLYAAFTILSGHQLRHLGQAERALQAVRSEA